MATESLVEKIDLLVRARYPLLYIVSWEEGRMLDTLEQVAKRRNRPIFNWSVSQGLQGVDPGAQDPAQALAIVLREKKERGGLYVFRDLHLFMNDPVVIRRLRDLSLALSDTLKTVVILSPVLKVVPELEKDITVVDVPLPGTAELEEVFNLVLDSARKSGLKIDVLPGEKEEILKASLGLTATEAENIYSYSLAKNRRFDLADIITAKEQVIKKSGILEFYHSTVKFSSVGGLHTLKSWLESRRLAFTQRAREFGLPEPKGVLLFGVQGCGKSLVAKAIAGIWQLPLLRLDVGKIFSSLVGSSEDNMRKAIRLAESLAPVVLWIDELEKAFAGTKSSDFSDAGTTSRVFGTFLTWMQEKTSPVFVVATSNHITVLPPELLRKGRFDELFFVDLPTFSERREIAQVHLIEKRRYPERFNLDAIAEETEGFSGAEIAEAINSGMFVAFSQNRDVTTEDIIQEARRTVPLSRTMRESIERLREFAVGRAVKASAEE